MAKKQKAELLVPEGQKFDYGQLEPHLAEQVRSAAARIRDKVRQTLVDIIEIGLELLEVKQSLPHGQFGLWIQEEFGWKERSARNFMAVAECFGQKTAKIAEMSLDPSAAYLLAARSTPVEVREAAIQRAEAGQHVGPALVREMLSEARGTDNQEPRLLPPERLAPRVRKALDRYLSQYDASDRPSFAKLLRDFADLVDPKSSSRKKGAKKT